MSFDWKGVVAGVAPALATVLGGPLAGSAVAVLAERLTGSSAGDKAQDEMRVAEALRGGLTPEIRAKIVDADTQVRLAMIQAGVREHEIELDRDRVVVADAADARKAHAGNSDLFTLGVIILVVWATLTGATLYGLFALLTGEVTIKDVGVVATVFTVLGSTIGYVSGIAQQVVSFYYGSSRGSLAKTAALGDAVAAAGRR